jgi:serine/threonine-protein kinase
MKLRAEIFVVAAALSASSFASADPEAKSGPASAAQAVPTRADALFTAAKQLRSAGLYEDACPKFAETAQIEPGVGVTLYLADCYEHTGRSANAWAEFRKAEKLARDRNDKRADVAKARADVLEAKLTRMKIEVAAKHPGLEIAVDGTQIRPENWNSVLPTDPGTHAVEVEEPGQPARTLNVHLDEGSILTVPVFEAAAAPAPAAPSTTEAPAESMSPTPPGGAARTYAGIGLLGVGAGGLVVGAGFLDAKNQAISKNEKSNAGTISGISFALAGAAFASAVVLYLTAPKDRSAALTVSAAPVASGTGAVLQGSF